MAVTTTRTATRTFTRVDLMKLQVERVLSRCRASESHIKKILRGLDRKVIGEVLVYGVDDSGKCCAELHVEIDWERNQLHVAAGRELVNIDDRWPDDIAIEVDMALRLFDEYCQQKKLRFEIRSRFVSSSDHDELRADMGFVVASPIEWATGTRVGSVMAVPEIDEFSVGVSILED
jgi:hypothetical protein